MFYCKILQLPSDTHSHRLSAMGIYENSSLIVERITKNHVIINTLNTRIVLRRELFDTFEIKILE